MNRAAVSCGCGATASFEDEHSTPISINVEAFHKAHEACRIARRDYRPEIQPTAPKRIFCAEGDCDELVGVQGARCAGCVERLSSAKTSTNSGERA